MGKKSPRVDAYIDRSAGFARPILEYSRQVVHEGCPEVEETIKWGFPHFPERSPRPPAGPRDPGPAGCGPRWYLIS